jgi:hypothetical protein
MFAHEYKIVYEERTFTITRFLIFRRFPGAGPIGLLVISNETLQFHVNHAMRI